MHPAAHPTPPPQLDLLTKEFEYASRNAGVMWLRL
jgi:hypothetical protein